MVVALLLGIFGVGLLGLGLLFLVGSAGQGSRIGVAVVALGLGAAALGASVKLGKSALARLPTQIRTDILAAAARRNGELSGDDLDGLIAGRRGEAKGVLAELVDSGAARREESGGQVWYVFRALVPRLTVRRCERCDIEYDWDYEPATCESCGGAVRTRIEGRSTRGEELYRMEE